MNVHRSASAPSARRSAGLGLALAAMAVVLHHIGRGVLRPPTDWSPEGTRHWIAEVGPIAATLAVGRLAAVAACLYGVLLIVLDLLVRITHHRHLVVMLTAVTLPPLRGTLTAATGLTLTAVGLVASPAAGAASTPTSAGDPSPVVIERLPDAEAVATEAATATMRQPEAEEVGGDEAPGPQPGADLAESVDRNVEAWTVRPGDHLWHVAAATLADAWGREPSNAEVTPYWSHLLEANRAELIDPDLLRPGQTLLRPTPPAAPALPGMSSV